MRVGIDARKIADFGIGTYIRGLLRGLVELETGDQYVAFAPAGVAVPKGIEHVIVDAPHYSLRELIAVGRAADRARLDVFHAPHYVVPFTDTPTVVTIHDLIHLHQHMRNPLAPLYARTMLRRAVRRARVVMTVTETVKREVEQELGAKNVVVTPNGVDGIAPGDEKKGRHFLFVGNDKAHKNVDALVAAYQRMPGKDVPLVLVGGDFARFRVVDGVVVRGFVSDEELLALYDEAIALVMPSREEGFGLPALEAMSRGTPVITSNASALLEVTSDAALHVEARDTRALAEAMTRVMNDASLRRWMRHQGLERARFFTWKRCAELTGEVYRRAS